MPGAVLASEECVDELSAHAKRARPVAYRSRRDVLFHPDRKGEDKLDPLADSNSIAESAQQPSGETKRR